MRIPKINKYRLERADKPETSILEVDIRPEEYYDNLDIFENDKEMSHFIIRSKYLIRGSYEYKKLIKFLKKYRGMYCCGIHNNLTTWDGFPIEVHHTPFTLEDIVYIVLTKRYKREESICMSDIADEVMALHYMGLVGLYPLCSTCHEYAHGEANDLFIPLDMHMVLRMIYLFLCVISLVNLRYSMIFTKILSQICCKLSLRIF